MELSIIIVNFNTKELLKKCLDSIVKSKLDFNFEIIVVDNGSTDGSVEYLKAQQLEAKRKFPHLKFKIIENQSNLGFGKANNQAFKKAQGEFILLLNSDTEVINGGIEKLLNFMKENKEVDIAGGELLEKDGPPQPSCGPFYSLPVLFLMLFLKGDKLRLTRWSPQKTRQVDWVSGACLMAKRRVFERFSFDEEIFMYMDEIEFLYRAKKGGFKVFFYPEAKFFHLGSGSSQGKEKKRPVLNIYRGLVYFYQKHHPGWRFFLLKLMLWLKAKGAIFWGSLTGNRYLKELYEEALLLVR